MNDSYFSSGKMSMAVKGVGMWEGEVVMVKNLNLSPIFSGLVNIW